jgi:hypothetical protein
MEESTKPKRVKLNVTIDSDVKAALEEAAASEGRSVSWIVAKAFTDYAQHLASQPLTRSRGRKNRADVVRARGD